MQKFQFKLGVLLLLFLFFSFLFQIFLSRETSSQKSKTKNKLNSIDSKKSAILESRSQIKDLSRKLIDNETRWGIFDSKSKSKSRQDRRSKRRCIVIRKWGDELRDFSRLRSANYPRNVTVSTRYIHGAFHLHNNNSRGRKCNRNECRRNITRLFPSSPLSAIINRRD